MTRAITNPDDLRATLAAWRSAGETIAFIPTMGALHRGHLALVEEGKRHATRTVASIFVNPTQFGPNEDFTRYPRPRAADLAALESVGADVAWLPDVATMYPEGFATSIHITGITEPLEGAHRPGHFDGVATIVAKLFNQVRPDHAIFGEKDYQQLLLIKRLVIDLNMHIKVIGLPTIREADGLALSSRNQYLSTEERKIAPQLHATLEAARASILSGLNPIAVLGEAAEHLLKHGFRTVDYLELRAADDLKPLDIYQTPARLLAAAHLGNTRLIDNIPI